MTLALGVNGPKAQINSRPRPFSGTDGSEDEVMTLETETLVISEFTSN